ncbi:MAG: succinate dehydrogenase assembly factor 2, partial [Proteobacteria bacterium]|nr:succinate dehydrogenase assembly factor 2 [Pseudomonadota bacterium]
MQETDILIGGFAKRRIGDLSDEQLDRFEALLDHNDNDLYD